jgi:hypothetical protein
MKKAPPRGLFIFKENFSLINKMGGSHAKKIKNAPAEGEQGLGNWR